MECMHVQYVSWKSPSIIILLNENHHTSEETNVAKKGQSLFILWHGVYIKFYHYWNALGVDIIRWQQLLCYKNYSDNCEKKHNSWNKNCVENEVEVECQNIFSNKVKFSSYRKMCRDAHDVLILYVYSVS